MVTIPLALLCVPLIESVNKFQNPFRCPVAMAVFWFGTLVTLWVGIGATFPIDESITLSLFQRSSLSGKLNDREGEEFLIRSL